MKVFSIIVLSVIIILMMLSIIRNFLHRTKRKEEEEEKEILFHTQTLCETFISCAKLFNAYIFYNRRITPYATKICNEKYTLTPLGKDLLSKPNAEEVREFISYFFPIIYNSFHHFYKKNKKDGKMFCITKSIVFILKKESQHDPSWLTLFNRTPLEMINFLQNYNLFIIDFLFLLAIEFANRLDKIENGILYRSDLISNEVCDISNDLN